MFIQFSLLHFFIILLLPPTLSFPISKEGCLSQCGDLSIPFPFGVGSNCSLNNSFNINCNTSTYPPKPYLSVINAEIIEINRTYVQVKYPNIVSVCYDDGAVAPSYKHSVSMNLSGTPFRLSDRNKLTVIGCDDMMLGFAGADGRSMFGGCSAFCGSDRGGEGYCTNNITTLGNGCCDAPIDGATDTRFLKAQLIDMSGKLSRKRLYSCSYAFIKEWNDESNESSVFSYPWYYLDNSTALVNDNWASATEAPVVRLDWTIIDAYSCSQGHICPKNSVCIDGSVDYYIRGSGYLCACMQGYEGNPYLPGGCTRISSVIPVAKTKCPDRCGNLSIVFPFGVGKGCYLEPSFNIHCNISSKSNIPKPYLADLNAEVYELDSSHVSVNYPNLGFTCYNLSYNQHRVTEADRRRLTIDLSRTQYSFSDGNLITAIGCHDMLVGVFGRANNHSFINSSCATVCTDRQEFGFCRSNGCCRTAIPRGTSFLEAKLSDLSEEWPRTELISCSYAYVQYKSRSDTGDFIFNNATGIQLHADSRERLLVLDWRIGTVNCEEAQKNKSSYACVDSNSYCHDFDAMLGGYRCYCSKGFQGNPYIKSGCQGWNM